MSTQDERFPRCRKAGLFPMPLHYKGAHIVDADAVEALLERLERGAQSANPMADYLIGRANEALATGLELDQETENVCFVCKDLDPMCHYCGGAKSR
jgi:hypothetical protein